MSDKKTAVRASSVHAVLTTFGASVLVAFLSLINVLLVARTLGATGRGEAVFLMTIAGLTGYAFTLSVQEANANLVGQEPASRPALATNSVILALVLGLLGAGVIFGASAILPGLRGHADGVVLWIALAAIPMVILQNYLMLLVRGDFAAGIANIALLIPAVGNVAVNGCFAVVGSIEVATVIATWTFMQGLACVALIWHVHRRLAGFGRPDGPLSRRSLSFGLKSHIGGLMSAGNYRLDQWILGAIGGSRELGLYSVAVAWAEALFFLPTALALAYRPVLVRSGSEQARIKASAATRLALVATIPLAIALFLAAPFLCVTLIGAEFGGAVEQLRILVPSAFGIVILKILGNALVAQNRPLYETASIAIAFACTVALDFLLIPAHGGVGAAVASTVSYTVAGLATAVIFIKVLRGRLRELIPTVGDLTAGRLQLLNLVRTPTDSKQ